jgi:hypothetical protein
MGGSTSLSHGEIRLAIRLRKGVPFLDQGLCCILHMNASHVTRLKARPKEKAESAGRLLWEAIVLDRRELRSWNFDAHALQGPAGHVGLIYFSQAFGVHPRTEGSLVGCVVLASLVDQYLRKNAIRVSCDPVREKLHFTLTAR